MSKSKSKFTKVHLFSILAILVGAISYPLLHLPASTPEINAVNSANNYAKTNVNLKVNFNVTNKSKCVGSTFNLSSTLAYTTLINQTPTKVNSDTKSFNNLPGNYPINYQVPTSTINSYGYLYKIGFTLTQVKAGKSQTLYTQAYKPVNNTVNVNVTCK